MRFFKEMKMNDSDELPDDMKSKLVEVSSEYFKARLETQDELLKAQSDDYDLKSILLNASDRLREELLQRAAAELRQDAYRRAERLLTIETDGLSTSEITAKVATLTAQLVIAIQRFPWTVSEALLPVLDIAPGEPGSGTPRQSR
jgi:hypothetical protein